MKYIVLMTDGFEVIGKVGYMTDHTVSLQDPVPMMDLFRVQPAAEMLWYSKNNKLDFNRDTISYEYEPLQSLVDAYEAYIGNKSYKELVKDVDRMLVDQMIKIRKMEKRTCQDEEEITNKILDQLGMGHSSSRGKMN